MSNMQWQKPYTKGYTKKHHACGDVNGKKTIKCVDCSYIAAQWIEKAYGSNHLLGKSLRACYDPFLAQGIVAQVKSLQLCFS